MGAVTTSGIVWTGDVSAIREEQLQGFFVGWPTRPTPAQHLASLQGSLHAVVALDGDGPDAPVVGFMTVVGDGALVAFVPWLEVLPQWQGLGIGRELVRRAVDAVPGAYSVDLVCDEDVAGWYERLGWTRLVGMGLRRPAALGAAPRPDRG
jgi:GNAT superfamily N-acetyltransferase